MNRTGRRKPSRRLDTVHTALDLDEGLVVLNTLTQPVTGRATPTGIRAATRPHR